MLPLILYKRQHIFFQHIIVLNKPIMKGLKCYAFAA